MIKISAADAMKLGAVPGMKRRGRARGLRAPGVMNKLEQRYAGHLEQRRLAGEVLWWAYEAVTFRLAKDTRYTPDFVLLLADGLVEFRETKGYWRDDAKVKIKVAAALFPFRFVAVTAASKKDGGGWKEEEF